MKGWSGTTEAFMLGVIFSIILLAQFGLFGGCSLTEQSPREKAKVQCEEAWTARYVDHDEDDNDTLLLDEQWCQAHNNMVDVEVQSEQQQVVQEAQTP